MKSGQPSESFISLHLFPNVRSNIPTSRMLRSQAENEASDKKVKMSYIFSVMLC